MLSIYLAVIESKEDERSFSEIYRKYSKLMYKITFSYTNDHHLAEDALQIAFMGVAKNIVKIKRFDESVLEIYLCKAAKNCAFSVLRKELPKKTKTVSMEELYAEPSAEETLSDAIIKKELMSKVINYISSMEEVQRDIISLHFLSNLTIKECAKALNLPVSTVKTKLYRALKGINTMLKEKEQ